MTAFQKIRLLLMTAILLSPVAGGASSAPLVNVLEPIATGVSTPVRLAEDLTGNFYLTDPRSGGILKFNGAGLHTATFTVARPQGVAVTPSGDMIVGRGDSVIVLSPGGQEKFSLGKGAGQFRSANGIAVDTAGYIFVVDSLDNCVQIFNSQGAAVNSGHAAAGKPANSFGSSGSADGQLAMPTGIAFEKNSGQLAVADTNNGRIQFFDTSGVWKRTIGSMGVGNLRFTSPVAVAFEYAKDKTAALARMYVTDSFQSSVQVIDPAANPVWLGFIGSYGRAKGKLLTPGDALFDQVDRRLLVANGFGNIAVYGIDGGATQPVDTTPPALTINPAPAVTSMATLVLSGTIESGATLAIATDTAATAATPAVTTSGLWTATVSGLVAGINNITVIATDAAGNTTSRQLSVAFNAAALNLTINAVTSPTNSSTQTIGGTMTAGATVAVTVSTTATAGTVTYPTTTTWRSVISGLVPGDNTITVTASKAGSVAAINRTAINLDTTPPPLAVAMPADGSTTGVQLLTITGLTAANIAAVTVNGNAVVTVNGLFSKGIILADGVNTIIVQATDSAGNITTETRRITFDPTVPAISITTPTSGKVLNQTTLQVSGTSSAGSTITVKVNGSVQANIAGANWSATVNLVNGIGLYTIEAIASSGGKSATTSVAVSLVDLTEPVIDLAAPPTDIVTNNGSLSLGGSAAAASVTATLNGTALPVTYQPANSGYSLTVSFPAEGTYTLLITATDAFGNTSNVFRTLIFDLTPPAVSVTSQTATAIAGRGEADATIVVRNATGSVVGTAVVKQDGTWSVPLTGAEVLPLNVQAVDAAGNSSRNGDINGSGGPPDIADALKAMRLVAGLDPAPAADSQQLLRGDVAPLVNGVSMPDGRIDIDDVMVILMKAVGLMK